MARRLKNLTIEEVSSVDRGAGHGVRVALIKRDVPKKEPDNKGDVQKDAIDFETASENIEASEDACDLMHELGEAICALDCSVRSILCDDDVTDKPAAIAETFQQFKDHISGLKPEDLEKTMTTPSPAVQKMIDDAVAAAVTKATSEKDAVIAKQADDLAIAKMSDKHKAHADTLDGDQKKKFAAMSPEDRDAEMEKTKKRDEESPVVKALSAENTDLKKRVQAMEDREQLEICKREAKEMGMAGDDAGQVLMKARRGDVDALAKVEAHAKGLVAKAKEAQKLGKVFDELGDSRGGAGGDATAYSELKAKAAELRKSKPELSEPQAFDKVLTDPANRELAARERDERMAKIHKAA